MKTYRQSMDELHFTQEEKRELTDRLMAGETRKPGRVRSLRRTVAVGAAAALLMTMGAGAAMVLTRRGRCSPPSSAAPPRRRRSWTRWECPLGPATPTGE